MADQRFSLSPTKLYSNIIDVFRGQWFITLMFMASMFVITFPQHVYIKDILCVFLLLSCSSGRYDKVGKALIFFSLTYTIFATINNYYESVFEAISYLIGPISFYLYGKRIVRTKEKETVMTFYLLLIICATCLLIRYNIYDAIENGLVNVSRMFDKVQAGDVLSATVQGLIASLGISGFAYVVASGGLKSLKSLIFLIVSLLSLFVVIHLVNRTGLVLVAATCALTFVYLSKGSFKPIIYLAVSFVVIYYVLVAIGIINEDIFSAYENRELNEDSGSSYGGRTGLWLQSLELLMSHPMGWTAEAWHKSYSHNLLLDTARCAGWIPLIILMYVFFCSLNVLKVLFRTKGDSFVAFLIGVSTCLFLAEMVEPALQASSTHFYVLCMVIGFQVQYFENKSRR